MFIPILLGAGALGLLFLSKRGGQHGPPAVDPTTYAQTQNAIGMSLAHDAQAGANLSGLNADQLTQAWIRGDSGEIAGIIGYLNSLSAHFTAQAFASRSAQIAHH